MRTLVAVVMVVGWFCVNAWTMNETGLVAHYDFDKSEGSIVADVTGNGNDGKMVGGVKWVKGLFGSALEFDGKDGYVDCGAGERLNIGAGGSVLFWYKPVGQCQGGLVCWTKGGVDSDQRLVTSLNTYMKNRSRGDREYKELGLYMSDGQNFIRPFDSNFHEAYFPPADKWEFYGVTFNSKSIDIYRDGVLVYSRFQPLVPDTKDVPLWIGRCIGMGGPSDYFKGLIDEVRIYNRSLTDEEIYKVYMKNAVGRDKDTSNFNTIGIKPIVCPKQGTIFADLNYRGLVPTPPDMTIKAELFDRQKKVISVGKVRMLPVLGQSEVTFDMQNLSPGDYTLQVVADKGKPNEVTVKWPGRAEGWSKVKVLNNFCWELLNETPVKEHKDKYTFTTPRKGWVYFITECDGNLTLSVDKARPSNIYIPGKGVNQEEMRWLEKGDYSITVSGNGTLKKLIVRSTPMLIFCHYPHVGPGTGNDHEFLLKHVLPHVNTLITGNYGQAYNTDNFRDKWANEMGRQSIEILHTGPHCQEKLTDENAKELTYKHLAEAPGMNSPEFSGVILDEFDPGDDTMRWIKSYYDEWIESCTKVLEDPKYKGRYVIPFFSYNMFDFEKSAAFCRAFVNHGSYLANEVYLDGKETEGEAYVYINDALADLADDWERAIPGAIEHMIVALSYLEREYWNPDVDFKVYMDMQFNHLATRPEFFGLAGVMEYQSHNANEEYIRYAAKLCRHYGLEGQTERLSKDPYNVSHIKNGDFINGTEGWNINMAKKDSMVVKNQKGYGVLQVRCPYLDFTDTYFLWTKRCENKPNVFSQEIKNLKPGRLYSIKVVVGDYQELIEGKSLKQKHEISINIENADLFNDWYKTASIKNNIEYYKTWRSAGKFSSNNSYNMNIHHRVFRAKGETARLTITDWKSGTEPGGPIGQELILNSIQVQPYLKYE